MSLHDEAHLQHFLKNKEMNEMYLSVFLMALAQGLISIFVPIYLYFLNYSIPYILFYYFLISLYFIALAPFLIKWIPKIGVKHSMGISVPFYIIYFLGLSILESASWLFYILPAVLATRLIFYNIGYHLNYIEHSDAGGEEKEVSILASIPLVASLLSPLAGGFIAFVFGYSYLYAIGSIILSISMIPLFLTKDQKEKITFKTSDLFKGIVKKENRFLTGSFAGYASTTTIGLVVWPLFLTTLDISIKTIGSIVSITAVLTLILFYFIGEKNDTKNEKEAIARRSKFYTIGWIARIFADSAFSAFMIDAYKTVTFKLLFVPWASFTYNVAKRKSDYFKFLVSRELTFNISRIIILSILIYIFIVGFYPFVISFLLASLLSLAYSLIIKHS